MGVNGLTLEEVMEQYVEVKQEPSNTNGLLDFIQQLYISDIISITEYRSLLREVSNLGATKPDFFPEKTAVK